MHVPLLFGGPILRYHHSWLVVELVGHCDKASNFFFSCFLSIYHSFLGLFSLLSFSKICQKSRASLLAYNLPSISGCYLCGLFLSTLIFCFRLSLGYHVSILTWILGGEERVTSAIFPARCRSLDPLDDFPIPRSLPLGPAPVSRPSEKWTSRGGDLVSRLLAKFLYSTYQPLRSRNQENAELPFLPYRHSILVTSWWFDGARVTRECQ